jgi:hypothetical protein
MNSETVHLFMCGGGSSGSLFALSRDRSGANLPRSECPTGWAFEKTIDLADPAAAGELSINSSAALPDLARAGYHVFKTGHMAYASQTRSA